MTVSVYLPLVASLVLAVGGRLVARLLAPAPAVTVLVTAGALTAVASGWGLVLLAGTLLDDAWPVERAEVEPVPDIVGLAAAVALVVSTYRVICVLRAHREANRQLHALCAACGDSELAVANLPTPFAAAVRGRPGRILVTTGMLRVLDAHERRVLIEHERAHLRCHHGALQSVVDIAAGLNPLLIPLRRTVGLLNERWADEAAAVAVGCRRLVARSVARAALASTEATEATEALVPGSMGFDRLSVCDRVAALCQAPLHNRASVAVIVLLLGGATMLAAVRATVDFWSVLTLWFPGLV
jgi:Zn-dependent protease with chaperone function